LIDLTDAIEFVLDELTVSGRILSRSVRRQSQIVSMIVDDDKDEAA